MKEVKDHTVSTWPSAKSTAASARRDIRCASFEDLSNLFGRINTVPVKVNQAILTRTWQSSRKRAESTSGEKPEGYIVTLDYDHTGEDMGAVATKLDEFGVNYALFTTWSHEGGQDNSFKVVIDAIAESREELISVTRGLAVLTGKKELKTVDDFSTNIFFGGCKHKEKVFIKRKVDNKDSYLRLVELTELSKRFVAPKEAIQVAESQGASDFELWDATIGQKHSKERIEEALKVIKYEKIEDIGKMQIWYTIGYALHSCGVPEYFELWDDWCANNCAENGTYSRAENEAFWAKTEVPKSRKSLCTLASLWRLESKFLARSADVKTLQHEWVYFDQLAESEPEEQKFLVDGLLQEKSIGFLVGTGGVGKSTFCLELAKSLSSGAEFFGKTVKEAGSVVLINKEDGLSKVHRQVRAIEKRDRQKIRDDIKDLSDAFDSPPVVLKTSEFNWGNVIRPAWADSTFYLSTDDTVNQTMKAKVIESLEKLALDLEEKKRPPLKLIIFDPMNMFHSGDQNSQKDMSAMFSAFSEIGKALDVCVLIVHHMNKSRGFSGSHTIRDSGRFMWALRPTKEGDSRFIELFVDKNNDAKAGYPAVNLIQGDFGLLSLAKVDEEVKK